MNTLLRYLTNIFFSFLTSHPVMHYIKTISPKLKYENSSRCRSSEYIITLRPRIKDEKHYLCLWIIPVVCVIIKKLKYSNKMNTIYRKTCVFRTWSTPCSPHGIVWAKGVRTRIFHRGPLSKDNCDLYFDIPSLNTVTAILGTFKTFLAKEKKVQRKHDERLIENSLNFWRTALK